MSILSDFFDERNFISICPNPMWAPHGTGDEPSNNEHDMIVFEFFSGSRPSVSKPVGPERKPREINKEATGNTKWLLPDEDPSPRPPKCTVLWRELLNLKKSSPSVFSMSSSPSHEVSSSGAINRDKCKGKKKGIRIRSVLNVPICSHARSTVFSPTFPARKGRKEE